MKDLLQLYRIGQWSGICAFLAVVTYCVVQILQLYGVITFPDDERLIYGSSLCVVVPFLIEMHVLHYTTNERKRFYTQLAISFTVLYAMFVTANYVVQLATVIPSAMKDNLEGIRILQQTPHSLFWNFDAIGYICMGCAMFAAAPALGKTGLSKWVRFAFLLHAATTPLISLVYFYPDYSYKLLLLASPWAITAPFAMLMPAILFHKRQKDILKGLHKSRLHVEAPGLHSKT